MPRMPPRSRSRCSAPGTTRRSTRGRLLPGQPLPGRRHARGLTSGVVLGHRPRHHRPAAHHPDLPGRRRSRPARARPSRSTGGAGRPRRAAARGRQERARRLPRGHPDHRPGHGLKTAIVSTQRRPRGDAGRLRGGHPHHRRRPEPPARPVRGPARLRGPRATSTSLPACRSSRRRATSRGKTFSRSMRF